MAVIQKIRNRAGLLVAVIIGMALIAFILGDLLTSGGLYLSKARNNVAVVNGTGIPIDQFQDIISEQEELTKMQMGVSTLEEQATLEIRQRAWNDMIQDLVISEEIKKLGLSVSGDELYNMINGDNPHQFIVQFFADPTTGVINHVALNQFLQQINSTEEITSQKLFWLYIEDLIYKERETTKYNTLLSKGFYATNLEANKRKKELNTSVNFNYIVKRYTEIPDSLVNLTDDEIKKYYKHNKNNYKQDKSRDIRYVVWEVLPSEKDYAETENWINKIKNEYIKITPENTNQYTKANSAISPNGINYAQGELDASLDSFAFASTLGNVYGPYFEEGYYKLAKLSKVSYLSDSVKASHILLAATQDNGYQMNQLADSLKTLIEKGASISTLAMQYSTDKGSAEKGGDLGWFKEGQMVKPFSDSSFYGNVGDVKIVYSQYGIHILKIEAQSRRVKKVQLAVLARQVRASEATDQTYFAKASEFGAVNNTPEKFNKAIAEGVVKAIPLVKLTENTNNIAGLERSRELIRWAFNGNVGDITGKVMEFDNKYVIAIIDKVREKGFTPVEDLKSEIEIEVRKEKQGDLLAAKMQEAQDGISDINTIGANLNIPVNNASNVRFTSYTIPNLGAEPKLQAAAIALEEGKISAPIKGNNGVYIIQVESKNMPTPDANNTMEKNYITRTNTNRVTYSALTVLNELAGVEDNRINFY
jgi:peptidyl-prolyl cis-trans isomerase D